MWKHMAYFLFLFVIVTALSNAIIAQLWLMVGFWVVMGAVVTSFRHKLLA